MEESEVLINSIRKLVPEASLGKIAKLPEQDSDGGPDNGNVN
jgi:hypothetical protein